MVLTEFVKVRKATISFVRLSLGVSVRPYPIPELPKDGFYLTHVLGILLRSVKFNFCECRTKIGSLYEDLRIFIMVH